MKAWGIMVLYIQLDSLALVPRSLMQMSVRWNCPWHRNSFRPSYFPFKMHEKLRKDTVEARTETRGGRLMLMRRVLREQPFLGYLTRPSSKPAAPVRT